MQCFVLNTFTYFDKITVNPGSTDHPCDPKSFLKGGRCSGDTYDIKTVDKELYSKVVVSSGLTDVQFVNY